MRTVFTKITTILAGLSFICSCDLSMTDTYSFTNVLYYTVSTEDEESRATAITDFFKSCIDFDTTYTYTGSQYDAIVYGQNKMMENLGDLTNEEVEAVLEDGEVVQYAMSMTSTNYKGIIGTISWTKEDEEEDDDDIDSDL